jgi:hypothetical protein
MNCCDEYGECRQGRDCPVRKAPAKVAKVKQRLPGDTPLPASPLRAYLGYVAKWLLIAVASILIAAVVLLTRWLP